VDFSISTDRFKLGEFVAQHEGLTAELERIVPTGDLAIPYVWVTGMPDQLDAITQTFETSDNVASVTVLDDLPVTGSERRQYLYRIEWILEDLDIIKGIVTTGGAILEGRSTDHMWDLRFRFEDHQNVAEFYQYLTDNNISAFQINQIYELQEWNNTGRRVVSPEQRDALTVAAQQGYFDLPREATLTEIGEELGITQQAASERVRRGVRNLVFDELNIPTTS
jgi:predicted DNA binding protein